MNIAQQFPARYDADGRIWRRTGKGDQDGWTDNIDYAHPDYRAADAPAPIPAAQPPAERPNPAPPTQPPKETAMARSAPTHLDQDGNVITLPRFTPWMRYPLPPENPNAYQPRTNQWNWYMLPSPTTGRPTGYPRATTVSETLDDKSNLSKWSRRETAQRISYLTGVTADTVIYPDPTGDLTAGDLLAGLREAMDAGGVGGIDMALDRIDNTMGGADARELGQCVHAWLEALFAGLVLYRDVPEVVRPHVDYARKALVRHGIVPLPQYAERIVMNDQCEDETVTGRIDGIGKLVTTDELVLLDVKTSKDLKYGWLNYGVQVGGVYLWATKMLTVDGTGWEPMPEIRTDWAALLHVPSNQPEKAALITINAWWGGEMMQKSVDVRMKRKNAKVEVPKGVIPAPSDAALRYATARQALSDITTPDDGQAVYEAYSDVWDDALQEFATVVAGLL